MKFEVQKLKNRAFNEHTSIYAISIGPISAATVNSQLLVVAQDVLYRAPLINMLTSPISRIRDHLICMELWPSDKHRLAYMTSLLVFQYCLPLVLVLLCYLRIFLRLKRRRSHSYILIFLNEFLSQHICPPVSLTATVFCLVLRCSSIYWTSVPEVCSGISQSTV